MKRSKHNLSYYKLLSMKMGNLYPIGLTEVYPGDTIQHATNMLIRLQPLVAPVMHPCHARIHHWFVPHRLVWDSWEKFITGGPDGMDASVFPTISLGGSNAEGSVFDYYGLPTGINPGAFSALPLRGYQLIFNEWYRDQDLVAAVPISKASGNDATTSWNIQASAWEKDYFTTARPWAQKGPTVTIPLQGSAPITGISVVSGATPTGTNMSGTETGGGSVVYPFGGGASAAGLFAMKTTSNTVNSPPQIFANLSAVTAADINTLRKAFAIQRYQEARARYGSRYTEYLRYLGVRSSDARLQRPEYLGGGKQTIQFSEVLQTGVTSGGSVGGVGNMAGHGIGAVRSNRYRRFFEEHGYIHSFMSIKPITMYSQGVPKHWMYATKEDFWQKELEHIGQQEVLVRELWGNVAPANKVFGFQDRYDHLRRIENSIAGQFRSTLNYWHMSRIFGAEPVLNASFINSNPTNRIFADQSGSDTVLVMASHSIQARRLLTKVGTSHIF